MSGREGFLGRGQDLGGDPEPGRGAERWPEGQKQDGGDRVAERAVPSGTLLKTLALTLRAVAGQWQHQMGFIER